MENILTTTIVLNSFSLAGILFTAMQTYAIKKVEAKIHKQLEFQKKQMNSLHDKRVEIIHGLWRKIYDMEKATNVFIQHRTSSAYFKMYKEYEEEMFKKEGLYAELVKYYNYNKLFFSPELRIQIEILIQLIKKVKDYHIEHEKATVMGQLDEKINSYLDKSKSEFDSSKTALDQEFAKILGV